MAGPRAWLFVPGGSKYIVCVCVKLETDAGPVHPDKHPAVAVPMTLFFLVFLLRQGAINFFQAVLNSEAQIGFTFEILLPRFTVLLHKAQISLTLYKSLFITLMLSNKPHH